MVTNENKEENVEMQVLPDHVVIFRRTIDKLASIPCKESSVMQIELLFFDMLNILRSYKDHAKANLALSQLQIIKESEYIAIHNNHCTHKNRIVAIRRFKNSFSQTLYKAIK